jgi:hypothetical protein
VPTACGEEEEEEKAKGDLQEAGHRGGGDCPDGVAASSADLTARRAVVLGLTLEVEADTRPPLR